MVKVIKYFQMTTCEPGEMSMESHIQGRFCSQIISNHARDAVFYSNWLAWSRLRQKSDHFLPFLVFPINAKSYQRNPKRPAWRCRQAGRLGLR